MAHNRCSTNICERKKENEKNGESRAGGVKKGIEGKRKEERLKRRRKGRMVEKKEVQYLFLQNIKLASSSEPLEGNITLYKS